MPETWTWDDVTARRLRRHGLAGRPHPGPAAAAAAACGIHAQIPTAGELSLGLRLDGGTQDAVRRAVAPGGELVRTFGPRGTVHLLPVAELAFWTGALGAVRPLAGST